MGCAALPAVLTGLPRLTACRDCLAALRLALSCKDASSAFPPALPACSRNRLPVIDCSNFSPGAKDPSVGALAAAAAASCPAVPLPPLPLLLPVVRALVSSAGPH